MLCVSDKMSVSLEVKIKIVLLMAKFEAATATKRKRQSGSGKTTPTEHEIRTIFKRCENGNLEDRSLSGRSTVISQEKVDEVNDFLQTHPGSSVRSVTEASSIPQRTTHRIRTEHFLLKSYRAQFIQQLYEEDFQDHVKCCCHY